MNFISWCRHVITVTYDNTIIRELSPTYLRGSKMKILRDFFKNSTSEVNKKIMKIQEVNIICLVLSFHVDTSSYLLTLMKFTTYRCMLADGLIFHHIRVWNSRSLNTQQWKKKFISCSFIEQEKEGATRSQLFIACVSGHTESNKILQV